MSARNISDADRAQIKALRAAEREAVRAERRIRNAADLEQLSAIFIIAEYSMNLVCFNN